MAARRRDVVVIGGSAGAVQALTTLLEQLPGDLEAAIAITVHRHPSYLSHLAEVLGRNSTLPVAEPEQGAQFAHRKIDLAPQDRHMTVQDGVIQLNRQPRQHHTRPAIDPLFRSAALAYGSRVIGVLLTGNLSDGVGGLIEIKARGGLSLVQDPAEAAFPSMPRNALIYDNVDLVFQIESVGRPLARLIRGESVAAVLGTAGARLVRPDDVQRPTWLAHGRPLP